MSATFFIQRLQTFFFIFSTFSLRFLTFFLFSSQRLLRSLHLCFILPCYSRLTTGRCNVRSPVSMQRNARKLLQFLLFGCCIAYVALRLLRRRRLALCCVGRRNSRRNSKQRNATEYIIHHLYPTRCCTDLRYSETIRNRLNSSRNETSSSYHHHQPRAGVNDFNKVCSHFLNED